MVILKGGVLTNEEKKIQFPISNSNHVEVADNELVIETPSKALVRVKLDGLSHKGKVFLRWFLFLLLFSGPIDSFSSSQLPMVHWWVSPKLGLIYAFYEATGGTDRLAIAKISTGKVTVNKELEKDK